MEVMSWFSKRTTTSWSKLFEASAEIGPAPGELLGVPIGTIPEARATMPRRTDATTAPNIRFIRASIGESLLEADESKKREMMVLFQNCEAIIGRDNITSRSENM